VFKEKNKTKSSTPINSAMVPTVKYSFLAIEISLNHQNRKNLFICVQPVAVRADGSEDLRDGERARAVVAALLFDCRAWQHCRPRLRGGGRRSPPTIERTLWRLESANVMYCYDKLAAFLFAADIIFRVMGGNDMASFTCDRSFATLLTRFRGAVPRHDRDKGTC
jgi:hypothetical protein